MVDKFSRRHGGGQIAATRTALSISLRRYLHDSDVKLGIYMTVGPTHGIDLDLEFVGVDQIWILQALALHRI